MYPPLERYVDMWLSQHVGPGPSLSQNDNELIDFTDKITTDAIKAAFTRTQLQSFGPLSDRITEARRVANTPTSWSTPEQVHEPRPSGR